jgi:uncharacterized protein (DUF2147 family)
MGGSMSFCGVSGLDCSSLARLLLTAVLPVASMITSATARAQAVGANGMNGADCSTDHCVGGNGTDGESVTADGMAIGGAGGNGGSAYVFTGGCNCGVGGNGGNGGAASASVRTQALSAEPAEPPGISN